MAHTNSRFMNNLLRGQSAELRAHSLPRLPVEVCLVARCAAPCILSRSQRFFTNLTGHSIWRNAMNKILTVLLFNLLVLIVAPASATLNIFACEPEWAALAQELAADKADIYAATTALQDPHHVQARPSLIARARRAQLVICTGAQLEIGWLPVILQESGNPEIAAGRPGNFEAAHYVTMLEVPTLLSRSEGDVHPGGNPHIQ